MNSILDSVKKVMGLNLEDTAFDVDLIMYINVIIMNLNQLGVGSSEEFNIVDNTTVWSDFPINEKVNLESIKAYVAIRVRLLFDPPGTSFVIEALDRQAKEIEWRLTVQAEPVIEAPLEGG